MKSKDIVEMLKNYAKANRIPQKELGQLYGFTGDRAKNIFSGRTQLSADEVLEIISSQKIPFSELLKKEPYLKTYTEITSHDEETKLREENFACMLSDPQRIQGSIIPPGKKMSLTEYAREIMNQQGWWCLRNGWICAISDNDNVRIYRPISPDFNTAVDAMIKMEWIWETETYSYADWQKINGGKDATLGAKYCERKLREYILRQMDNSNANVDKQFIYVTEHYSRSYVEAFGDKVNTFKAIKEKINEINEIIIQGRNYTPPNNDHAQQLLSSVTEEENKRRVYFIHMVLELAAEYDGLKESRVEIPEQLQKQYEKTMANPKVQDVIKNIVLGNDSKMSHK